MQRFDCTLPIISRRHDEITRERRAAWGSVVCANRERVGENDGYFFVAIALPNK